MGVMPSPLGEGVRGPARGRMRGEPAEVACYREATRTPPSSAACGRQLPPKGKPLELAAASVYALRAAFGGCAPTRACGRSPSGEAFKKGEANARPLPCCLFILRHYSRGLRPRRPRRPAPRLRWQPAPRVSGHSRRCPRSLRSRHRCLGPRGPQRPRGHRPAYA